MSGRYIVFDVETPNHLNNSISGIGIAVVEGGKIVREISTLVDPEADFDYFNSALTGIFPEDVAGKPAFPELWQTIEPVMSSGMLIAHNAPFDMGVLSKCLRRYDIDWRDTVRYACTCTMGRACYPELHDHKLNTLCDVLGIELDHHRAGSDSAACAKLLIDYVNCGFEPESYARTYDLLQSKTLGIKNRKCR